MRAWCWIVAAGVALSGCTPGKGGGETAPARPSVRIGRVMVETGHRFELAGRAFRAGRWGLAQYEVHEILELFESDMRRAPLPGVCDDPTADGAYERLVDGQLDTLRGAARDHDAGAFERGYGAVSASCNGCHAGCGVSFVEVPDTPGEAVPRLDRVGAADAPPPGEPPTAEEAPPPAPPAAP